MLKEIFNEEGFSLPEIIIAATIMSMMSLGVAQMLTSQSASISYMEDRLARTNLDKYLSSMIEQSPDVCTSSLQGLTLQPNKTSNLVLKDSAGKVLFNPSNPSLNTFENLKITSITYKDVDVHSSGSGEGKINIIVAADRLRKGGGPQTMIPIELEQIVKINTTNNKIDECLSGSIDGLTCVTKDLNAYSGATLPEPKTDGAPYSFDRSFKLPSNTKSIRLFLNNGEITSHERCDNDYTCSPPKIDYIIYPGVTKVAGVLFKEAATLRLKYTEVARFDHRTCSDNSQGRRIVYKQEWFYDGRLLASHTPDLSTKASGCPNYVSKFPALNTNTLPVVCPITSGRNVSTEPVNLGFEVFK